MWYKVATLLMAGIVARATTNVIDSGAGAEWARHGRDAFLACEFRQATRSFERAVAAEPDSADLHFWLGKSYERLAEVSTPLTAAKNARKARRHLEFSAAREPHNPEYLRELFDFYVDSPEWFHGGLGRADAVAERISSIEAGDDAVLRNSLAASRTEHSGPAWLTRRGLLAAFSAVGRFIPAP